MKKKDTLIAEINQFLLNHNIESVSLSDLGRSFETSTGAEEGSVEIISVSSNSFVYYPAGQNDEEFDGDLDKLAEDDLEEILSAFEDYEADEIQTQKRIS